MKPDREYSDRELLRRLGDVAKPFWPHLAGLLALSALATPLALLLPVPLKIAVDSALGSHLLPGFLDPLVPGAKPTSTGALMIAVALLVVVTVLMHLQKSAVSVVGSHVGEKLLMRMRSRLFRHVQRLSLAYHDARGTADSASSAATITTGTVSSPRVSEAQRIPPVPKVGVGRLSG